MDWNQFFLIETASHSEIALRQEMQSSHFPQPKQPQAPQPLGSWDFHHQTNGVSWGYPFIAGWFTSWKIPNKNGWWLGYQPWLRKPPNGDLTIKLVGKWSFVAERWCPNHQTCRNMGNHHETLFFHGIILHHERWWTRLYLPSKHQTCCFKRQKMMVWPANTGLQQTFEWHGAAKASWNGVDGSWTCEVLETRKWYCKLQTLKSLKRQQRELPVFK